MFLKTFKAINVYGYLDFDISFNKDINFLVGGNGTGKTTALKLVNALLVPNFKELLTISFDLIELTVDHNEDIIQIQAKANGEYVELSINGVDEKLDLPNYSKEEFEFYAAKKEGMDELINETNRKYADHAIIKKISKLPSPIFLGLERRRENVESENRSYYVERELWLKHSSNSRAISAKRLIRGSLGISLMETEFLVQNAYRELKNSEEKQADKLRDSILSSSFQYTEFDFSLTPNKEDFWSEKTSLLARRKEIKDALSKIGTRDNRLITEVDTFFDRLTSLFETMQSQKDEGGVTIEWLTNKAQIDRISKVVEVIDEHKSKIDALFKPINDFLSTVNEFYEDSNKKLSIDTVGRLDVERPDGKHCSIEGLSSGERQLLVIFAHAFFNQYGRKNTVFIIDEPELSLHLVWQEKFAETILKIGPSSQFLLATHSPEIIGINKNKAIKCRQQNASRT
ncbi:AAA family ATPase [Methylomonas sp. 2BW1-5-20]|uniref:AAA family ATPase n=1 Tax=Methylomonas sp. 2BW1-5-20 TaxID=3376686 RepID=UPI00404DE574